MPDLGGEEVFREMQRLRSDILVILASGFKELAWKAITAESKELEIRGRAALSSGAVGKLPLGTDLIYGPDLPRRRANALRNVKEERIVVVQGWFESLESNSQKR